MTGRTPADAAWERPDSGQHRTVDQLVAQAPLSPFAVAILLLCIAAGMSEGYDTQVMALAAPMIARGWGLAPHQTGLLLSGSVIGVVAGSFLLSPLGDRWGRRPSILLGLAGAGIATLSGGFAPSLAPLLASRFVAGLGLGLAFPNVIALAMEFMPARFRALAIVLVNCGYPLGAGTGAAITARLVPVYGVAAIFLVGGVATIAIALLALVLLPESPLILARKSGAEARLRTLLWRLGVHPADDMVLVADGRAEVRAPAAALFAAERRRATVLLWTISFATMMMVYYLFTWLPSIVAARGATPQLVILSLSAFTMGGVAGGIVMALLLPRLGPTIILSSSYGLTIAATVALCTFRTLDGAFLATLALVGGATGGAQFCLSAVVNHFYPSAMRVTASGYATGIGRVGAIIAPAAGVVIMSRPGLAAFAFAAPAIPACLALAALLLLHASTAYADGADAVR